MANFNDSWRSGGTGRGSYVLLPRTAGAVPLSLDGLSGSADADVLFRVRKSDGTVVFSVTNAGNISFAGSGTIVVNQTITGNLTVNGNTTLGDASGDTLTVNATSTFASSATFSSSVRFATDVTIDHNLTVSNSLIVNSILYLNSDIFIADDKSIMLGNDSGAPDVRLQWDTADADAHFLSLVLSGSNNFIISADNNIDWTHAAGTNPTLFIQSADQATVADYVSISHDQTNGIIATGSGTLFLIPTTAYVQFGPNTTGFPAIRTAASSDSAPAYAFTGDLDSGIFWQTGDSIGITAGGVEMLTLVESTSDELVVNQDQADCDFRVESDTRTQGFLVDANGEFINMGNGTKCDGWIHRFAREVQTTDATQTTVDSITLLDENTYHLSAYVIGVQSTGGNRASYHIEATAYRTGAGAATLQGAVTSVHSQESDGTWDVTFTVSSNDVRVSVTGVAATTIEWTCVLEFINMSN